MAKNMKSTQEEQLELGKKLQQFYDSGYINKKQTLLFSFYKGIASGFGVVIGGTIVIALLIWLLGLFDELPFLGDLVDSINRTIQSK